MMASSSQDFGTKYDVFISFRGTDVRSSFLSHLKEALQQQKIDFYVDDRLEKGDEISQALVKAIDESAISLVIFSKDYASSKWCLEELVKIMECMQRNQQIVIPVFYNTDPSDVRHQKGCYGDAFTKHDKYNGEKVQIWRYALNKAADLSGFHSSQYKDEAELVKKVAKALSSRLNMQMCPYHLTNLVGIEKKISELQTLMNQESHDIHVIGIWGMGGIGKTTLATEIFYRFCFEYEGFCILENVKEGFKRYGGVIHLKNKLFSSLLREKDLHIDTSHGLPLHVKRKLFRTKVLVVLDDVDDSSQLEKLVGTFDCFGLGSRIIITTRNKEVLDGVANKTYEVMPLMYDEALELFNLNAFRENCIDNEGNELSKKVIEYAKELPLAVKVLGSFLRGKNKEEWKSQLEKLKQMSFKKINDVLKLSFDTLDRQQQSIFLYIACCLKGYKYQQIIDILDSCGFSTKVELKVLRDKALITWESELSIVSMHDLIEEMGKEIAHEKSKDDPCKSHHLWHSNDILEVFQHNKGTECIQSITMDKIISGSNLLLSPQVFSRMHKLKILKISLKRILIELPEGLESLPNELRVLDWLYYPLEYMPSTFFAKYLVELHMGCSFLKKLWDGVVPLENLKIFDLHRSKYLVELPDLSLAKNLLEVLLEKCESLCVVHPSIFVLPKLEKLDLTLCTKLTSLQCAIPFESLSHLLLSQCYRLEEFSVKSKKMIMLDLSYTDIEYLPLFVGCLRTIENLILDGCWSLIEVSSNFVRLSSLRSLVISGCKQLLYLPQLPPSIVELWAPDCISLQTLEFTSKDGTPLNIKFASICLINCTSLDGHAQKSIRLIARLSLSTYARKSPGERKNLRDYGIEGKFIYPDSKVPKWFKHRTQQGKITITPHSKLLGFIFCMILLEEESVRVDWFLENNDSERLNLLDMGGHTVDDSLTLFDYLETLHAFIYYAECNEFINERIKDSRAKHQNPKVSFEFLDCETNMLIRKCGVYPIYAEEEDGDEEEEDDDEDDDDDDDDNDDDDNDDDDEDDDEDEDEDNDDEDEDEDEEEELEMGKKSKRSGDNYMDELKVLPPSKRQEF